MEKLLQWLLIAHIAGGVVSLLFGIVPMAVAKGNKTHRLFGNIFFAGMTVVFITGLSLSILKHLQFLLLISLFSYYLVANGYRNLYLKKLHMGQKPTWVDWAIIILSGLAMAYMVIWGSYLIYAGATNMGIITLVFGTIGSLGVIQNIKKFGKGPKRKTLWIEGHISGMIGGYIAAFTAFVVVNNDNYIGLPPLIAWLGPTAILVPLIIYWTNKYKKPVKA